MRTYNTGLAFMRSQDKLLDELIRNNVPLQIAATEAHRHMVKRIFEDGKGTDGAEIKSPSTTPIYINPNNSPKKFAPAGKGEDKKNRLVRTDGKKKTSIRVSGEDRKTKYFEGGYAEFKKLIDRPKLVLFGTMRNDFRAGIKKLNQFSWISYFKNSVNALKADGLEARYQHGEIFSPSKEEILLFKKLLVEGTIKHMEGLKDD